MISAWLDDESLRSLQGHDRTGSRAMVKMLTKSGNSLGLVIDKACLKFMNPDETTPVQIEVDGERPIVSSGTPGNREKFEAVRAKLHQR